MQLPKAAVLILVVSGVLLTGVLLVLSFGDGRQAPNDANIGRAVRERLGGAAPICAPRHIKVGELVGYPLSDDTARDIADLSSLGLLELEGDDRSVMIRATAKGQPYVRDGQFCLAQYSYGHLKSLADTRVTDSGLNTLVAHVEPVIEPLPNVPAAWLSGVSSIGSVQGMTAEMIETAEGWRANSVSLY